MATVKVADREVQIRTPRGRAGRKATNFLISSAQAGNVDQLTELMDNETFLTDHLPAFLGEDAKFVDENATTAELLNVILAVLNEVFSAFGQPEVSAALKNSQGPQAAEE